MSGHEPFKKMGMDVFIVASPTRNTVYVADAEAVNQITSRRNDFPKPLEMYGSLDIYGKNLVSTGQIGVHTVNLSHRASVTRTINSCSMRLFTTQRRCSICGLGLMVKET
jgi:hypothetical protein